MWSYELRQIGSVGPSSDWDVKIKGKYRLVNGGKDS